MSKGLASYPEAQRMHVAMRRMKGNTKGMGYWAASDYLQKVGGRKIKPLAEEVQEQQERRIKRRKGDDNDES